MEGRIYIKMVEKFVLILLILQINCIIVVRCEDSTRKSLVFQKEICRESKVEVEENVRLELICISDKQNPIINYYEKRTSLWGKSNRSKYNKFYHQNNYDDYHGKFIAVLQFNRLLYGDANNYLCKREDDVLCIRISIKTKNSFFLENNIVPQPKIILEMKGNKAVDPVIFNCEPTSSDFEVVYLLNEKKVPSANVSKPGIFKCQLKEDGRVVAEKSFEIVGGTCPKSNPKITGHSLPHATRNKTLRMNCTLEVNRINFKSNTYVFWDVEETNRITTREYIIPHPEFTNCATRIMELEFQRVTDDDAGELICRTVGKKPVKEFSSIKLKIHDDNFSECKLSFATNNDYRVIITKNVGVVVLIDSYPHTPIITWKDGNSNAIEERDEKFVVETDEKQTKLTIKNFSFSDDVSYTVEAKIPNLLVSESFELEVWENPLIRHLDNVMPYYMQNTTARIDCITLPDPNLRITWTFKPNPDSLPTSSVNRIEDLGFTSSNKTVTWTVQSSGNISCKACIPGIDSGEECYTSEKQIFMTDVPDGFGIIGPKRELMVGDRLELICAASIYQYTDQIEWKNSDYSSLDTADRMKIIKTKTLFSHRAVLTVNFIKQNNEIYTCVSTTKDGERISQDYKLTAHDPMEVSIISTNMNGTESTYSIDQGEIGPIILTCYSDGMPRPVISWSKDNVKMNPAKPIHVGECAYRFFNDSRELHIAYFHVGCGGIYRCIAVNNFSQEAISQTIIIRDSSQPEGGIKPTDRIIMIIVVLTILLILCIIVGIYCWIDKKLVKDRLIRASVMIDEGNSESQDCTLGLDGEGKPPIGILDLPEDDEQHVILDFRAAFHSICQSSRGG